MRALSRLETLVTWTLLSAATVIAIISPVLLTMVFQKYIVTALASGAGK